MKSRFFTSATLTPVNKLTSPNDDKKRDVTFVGSIWNELQSIDQLISRYVYFFNTFELWQQNVDVSIWLIP